MKKFILQLLIAVDQLTNTLIWAQGEGFGYADETISARSWRLRDRAIWGWLQRALDRLFFWDKNSEGQRAHTYKSWLSERDRHHLPAEYNARRDQVLKKLATRRARRELNPPQ